VIERFTSTKLERETCPGCGTGFAAGLRQLLFTIGLISVVLIAGCAPTGFTSRITAVAKQQGVRDASTSAVRGMEHLRFNTALRDDLDDALEESQLTSARESGRHVLSDAHDLAVHAVHAEVARLSPEALTGLADQYGVKTVDGVSDEHMRSALMQRFDAESIAALARDQERIDQARSTADVHRLLKDIRRRIEPAVGDAGRLGRILLAAPMYVPAAIGAELADAEATKRPTVAEFSLARVYEPIDQSAAPAAHAPTTNDLSDLARQLAPVFIQEINPDAAYALREDSMGKIELGGTPSDVLVQIDVDDPVVYWSHTQAKVRDRRYDQLVYVAWYPSRPALSSGDPQAGEIDGVVVRVTLDRNHRPAMYEFVRTCGCYHTLWVAEFVEQAARAEFGGPLPGMAYAVQKKPERSRELFMPALVTIDPTRMPRPVVMVNAGQHLVVTIDTVAADHYEQASQPPQSYRLEPYETLSHLPLGGQVASMFNGEGLVHHAARPEGWMLAPTGMLQAGRPRQLGTMKIRMDAYDYDDPRLLERNLRLPSSF